MMVKVPRFSIWLLVALAASGCVSTTHEHACVEKNIDVVLTVHDYPQSPAMASFLGPDGVAIQHATCPGASGTQLTPNGSGGLAGSVPQQTYREVRVFFNESVYRAAAPLALRSASTSIMLDATWNGTGFSWTMDGQPLAVDRSEVLDGRTALTGVTVHWTRKAPDSNFTYTWTANSSWNQGFAAGLSILEAGRAAPIDSGQRPVEMSLTGPDGKQHVAYYDPTKPLATLRVDQLGQGSWTLEVRLARPLPSEYEVALAAVFAY